jgi:hypothetical protein
MPREMQTLVLAGRRFDVTLWQEPGSEAWHWTITAPGVLTLLGEAPTRQQAVDAGRRAGLTLARLARRPRALDAAGPQAEPPGVNARAAPGLPLP